jgi:hypothetical protein
MEGDRRTTQNSTSMPQNWKRRIDGGHSHSNVPVLFRLKNLQRVSSNEADNASPPTKFEVAPARPSAEIREPKRAENSVPTSHALRSDGAHKNAPTPIQTSTKPATELKPDPVTTPGKHGVSNGVIFLIALVAIAFSIGRKTGSNGSPKSEPLSTIAANQSATASPSVVGSEISTTATQVSSSLSPEPLVVPTLPTLADDSKPVSTESSTDSATDNTPEFSTSKSENGLLTLDTELSSSRKDEALGSDSGALSVPLTLASEASDPKTANTTDLTATSHSLATDNAAVTHAKPSATSATTSTSEPSSSTLQEPTLLSTNTPNTDLENMFQIRANYQNSLVAQSQAVALAKTRQSPPDAGQQQNVPGYQPAYAIQNNPASNQVPVLSQPYGQPANVPAQPVGYGGQSRLPIQAPTYGSPSIPNATGITNPYATPTATMPSYVQSQNQTAPQGQATGSSPYAQPLNQPYVPVFKPTDAPAMNTGGFAVPPTSTPYVPIGSQFSLEGYPH